MGCSSTINGQPIHGRFTNGSGPDGTCVHCEFGDSREEVHARAAEAYIDQARKAASTIKIHLLLAQQYGHRKGFLRAKAQKKLARTYAKDALQVLQEAQAV